MERLIKLEDICAGYSDKTVLNDVSIDIAPKDFVGIIGPNGGGKTTLLRVILGMLKPLSGNITYYDASGKPTEHISMGYLPQHTQIDRKFPISVKEVVRSGLDTPIRSIFRANAASEKQLLDSIIARFGLQDIAGNHISELSGGQLQRVLLARAVISRPDVLILDEPSTYVDLFFQSKMYELLEGINNECAIIVVGHDVETLLRKTRSVVYVNHSVRQYDAARITPELASKLLSSGFEPAACQQSV